MPLCYPRIHLRGKFLPHIPLIISLLSCALPKFIYAQEAGHENIIVTDSRDVYEFEYSNKLDQVVVRQESTDKFLCRGYREDILFSGQYNNKVELNDVNVREGGRSRNAKLTTGYLSIGGEFYSDARTYYFKLAFPKQGAVNEVTVRKTILDPRYFAPVYLTEPYPVKHKEVRIIIPRWMKVALHPFNLDAYGVRKSVSYDAGKDADIYLYTASDLPPARNVPNAPGPTYTLPNILVCSRYAEPEGKKLTFFNSLDDQYSWYHHLVMQVNNDAVALSASAKEITKDITGDWEKIKAVFYWVEDNIRYIAFEDGIAGFKPADAQDVMQKKYGDCKGMANLTKALLQSLGFDARLCWIGTNRIAYDYSTPSLCVDNHMICAVKYKGDWHFLDATEGFMQPDKYAERIQGRQVLIENGESYLLEKIPAVSAQQNKRVFSEELQVDGDNITGNVTYTYEGESKVQLLNTIHSLKKDKLDDALISYITNDNRNYQVTGITTSDLSERDGNLNIRFGLTYRQAVSGFGNELYIDIDYNKEFNNALIPDSRSKDMRFDHKFDFITETTLSLPEGYKVEVLPEGLHVDNPLFSIDISYKAENGRISYRKEFVLKDTYLKKSQFPAWNEAIKQLSKKYLEQIILIRS